MKPMGVALVGQGRGPHVRARHVRARRQRSIHSRMISLTLDKPALELIDSGAAEADEPAVERSLIDNLVEAAVAGDLAAHDRLLAELYPLVLRYCRGRMGHRDSAKVSADDVAQEVCLAVVAALSSYTITGRSFRAFVYAIAAHKVADAFRAIGRDRTDPVAELPEGPVAAGRSRATAAGRGTRRAAGPAAATAHPATARGTDSADRGRAQRGGDGRGGRLHPRRRAGHPAPRSQPAPCAGLPTRPGRRCAGPRLATVRAIGRPYLRARYARICR